MGDSEKEFVWECEERHYRDSVQLRVFAIKVVRSSRLLWEGVLLSGDDENSTTPHEAQECDLSLPHWQRTNQPATEDRKSSVAGHRE